VLHFRHLDEYFENIMAANIAGYLTCTKQRTRTASSASCSPVRTTPYFYKTDYIDADSPMRPDSLYGVSKCFESLSRYYYDSVGIETVCLRIGSSFPEPVNPRMLVTWFSYDDLVESLRCSLFAPRVGHTILFGASNNPASWWDNSKAEHLGFRPKDSSLQFADKFPPTGNYPAADDRATLYQGGGFVVPGPQYQQP
jgi:uronate dehydrogenase